MQGSLIRVYPCPSVAELLCRSSLIPRNTSRQKSYGEMMDPVIELDGLEVRFGNRTILKKLKASLTGRSIGLLGPNGAGKSTLLNTLLGFHKPSPGRPAFWAAMSARMPAKSAA